MGDRGIAIILPDDRHFHHLEAIEREEIKLLNVEGEAIDDLFFGHGFCDIAAEKLVAALGIGDIVEMELMGDDFPRAKGNETTGSALFGHDDSALAMSRPNKAVRGVDDRKDLIKGMEVRGEIRIHEHDVIATRFEESSLDVMAFAFMVLVG